MTNPIQQSSHIDDSHSRLAVNSKSVIRIIVLWTAGQFVFACGQKDSQGGASDRIETYEQRVAKDQRSRDSIARLPILKRQEYARQWKEDSIKEGDRLELALQEALKVAKENLEADSFHRICELSPRDSVSLGFEILFGDIFEDNQRYLIVRRHTSNSSYVDLYKVIDGEFKRKVSRWHPEIVSVRDTVFDANGDGAKDFVLNWYPMSGCCMRNIDNVYLNNPKDDRFIGDYEFMNATFSPEEHIIRGVGYGHPGWVGLYKYKWHGFQIDTIEFIYPEMDEAEKLTGHFVKTKKPSFQPTGKDGVVLKSVPKEYRHIAGLEWFYMY